MQGRTIAAVIKEHAACGGDRALWVSTSKDLAFDAERDLEDVEADVDVHPRVRLLETI